MAALVWTLSMFAAAFLVHLVLWKTRVPARQTKALLRIFSATLAASLALLWAARGSLPGWAAPAGACAWAQMVLFYASLALAYVVTYSALQVDSPSLLMALMIDDRRPAGLTREEMASRLTDDMLVGTRLDDLIRDEGVTLEGGRYRATPRALRLIGIMRFYRDLMKVPRKGG